MTEKELLKIIDKAYIEEWPELTLRNEKLTTLPVNIEKLNNLTELDLSDNQLTKLPVEIGKLNNLTKLDLRHNKLTELPSELINLNNLTELDLRNNPLPLPTEIQIKTEKPRTIINCYLEHLESVEYKPLNEIKMLLVGQGGVGKTSLIKRLIHGQFDSCETKTKGIHTQQWKIDISNHSVRVNVWDFGYQKKIQPTHQFFLTKRSIYLLVLDARKDEYYNKIEYWLKLIQSCGSNSPIILVVNKCDDDNKPDTYYSGLKSKYKTIKGAVFTSCKTGKGIEQLEALAIKEISKLEHLHSMLPATWFEVKETLENLPVDYMPYTTYECLCREKKITDKKNQKILIGFLHDLGTMLNFKEDELLRSTNVLDPKWVTNGVYRILNHYLMFENQGILYLTMLSNILDCSGCPCNKHLFIINVMKKLELCFDFEETEDKRFLIPDTLPKKEPYTGEWLANKCLLFQYHYNILPGSIMSQFIVQSYKSIHKNTYWQSGVVLADGSNRALVKADTEEKKISITVSGPVETQSKFLVIIRKRLEGIHKTISKLRVEGKVPIQGRQDIIVDYQHLLNLEKMDVTKFIPEGLLKEANVVLLLERIDGKPLKHSKIVGNFRKHPVDTLPFDFSLRENEKLHKILYKNIAKVERIELLWSKIGVNQGIVNFNLAPELIWYEILKTSREQEKLRGLLSRIADEVPALENDIDSYLQ